MNNIKRMLRRFKLKITNLINWLPVIWRDRDWDHSYIFHILEHKLKLQAKGISKRDNHIGAQRGAQIMMTCVRLMEKIREGYYESEWMDYHKSNYYFKSVKDKPGYSTFETNIEFENFDDYFKKYPTTYKKVLRRNNNIFDINIPNEQDKKQRIAMNISHINHARAKTLLFKLMNENIEQWWD
jgi:hypothetical protein